MGQQNVQAKEVNCAIQWIVIYPVDSLIHLVNNWAWYSEYCDRQRAVRN